MTFLILLVIAAAGAFGYLVYRHGYTAAAAAVVGAGAAVWAALSGIIDMF